MLRILTRVETFTNEGKEKVMNKRKHWQRHAALEQNPLL